MTTSFAEHVVPSEKSRDLPSLLESGGNLDNSEREPVDLSNARGWELAIAVTHMAEENLIAAFDVVPKDDPHFEYLAANALQVLAEWRPSILDVPVFLRRMADPHVSHKELSQISFSKRFLPVVTVRLPGP
jgi:hypothetical protein